MFSSFTKDLHPARVERYAQFTRESSNITASDFVAVVDEVHNLHSIVVGIELTFDAHRQQP